jgi:hypothetical protein
MRLKPRKLGMILLESGQQVSDLMYEINQFLLDRLYLTVRIHY